MANQHTAKTIPPLEEIKELYFRKGMSQQEVGDHYGVTQRVIFSWFKKLGIVARVAAKRDQRGEKNHMWKGNEATYAAYHHRIESLKGKPKQCEECGTTDPALTYDWANLTGNYSDSNDYRRMCRSCHWKFDSRIENFGKQACVPPHLKHTIKS